MDVLKWHWNCFNRKFLMHLITLIPISKMNMIDKGLGIKMSFKFEKSRGNISCLLNPNCFTLKKNFDSQYFPYIQSFWNETQAFVFIFQNESQHPKEEYSWSVFESTFECEIKRNHTCVTKLKVLHKKMEMKTCNYSVYE